LYLEIKSAAFFFFLLCTDIGSLVALRLIDSDTCRIHEEAKTEKLSNHYFGQ